jgi:hypothetical protein
MAGLDWICFLERDEAMDFKVCAQCGKEIEGVGVQFRNRVFCGDECCDEFEAEMSEDVEIPLDDLDEDELLNRSHDDLGYREDTDLDDDFDDDFSISAEDF